MRGLARVIHERSAGQRHKVCEGFGLRIACCVVFGLVLRRNRAALLFDGDGVGAVARCAKGQPGRAMAVDSRLQRIGCSDGRNGRNSSDGRRSVQGTRAARARRQL